MGVAHHTAENQLSTRIIFQMFLYKGIFYRGSFAAKNSDVMCRRFFEAVAFHSGPPMPTARLSIASMIRCFLYMHGLYRWGGRSNLTDAIVTRIGNTEQNFVTRNITPDLPLAWAYTQWVWVSVVAGSSYKYVK